MTRIIRELTMKRVLIIPVLLLVLCSSGNAAMMHLKDKKFIMDITEEARAKGQIIFSVHDRLYKIPESLVSDINDQRSEAETEIKVETLQDYIRSVQPAPVEVVIIKDEEKSEPEPIRFNAEEIELIVSGNVFFNQYSMQLFNKAVERNNRFFDNYQLPLQNKIDDGMSYNLSLSWRYKRTVQFGSELSYFQMSSRGGSTDYGQDIDLSATEAALMFGMGGQVTRQLRLGFGINLGVIVLSGQQENYYNYFAMDNISQDINTAAVALKLYLTADYALSYSTGLTSSLGYHSANAGTVEMFDEETTTRTITMDFSGVFAKIGLYYIFR